MWVCRQLVNVPLGYRLFTQPFIASRCSIIFGVLLCSFHYKEVKRDFLGLLMLKYPHYSQNYS